MKFTSEDEPFTSWAFSLHSLMAKLLTFRGNLLSKCFFFQGDKLLWFVQPHSPLLITFYITFLAPKGSKRNNIVIIVSSLLRDVMNIEP